VNQIWTPDHARTLPRASLPDDQPITLADGRLLHFTACTRPEGQHLHCWDEDRDALGTQERARSKDQERKRGHLRVLATMDATVHGALLHVSLSYSDHLPDWETVKLVRAAFFPSTVDVMMVLPRPEFYVNVHEYTFHLLQTPVGWGQR